MVESTRKPPQEPWYKELPWMRRASYVAAFALVTVIAACFGAVHWIVPVLAVQVALALALIGLELPRHTTVRSVVIMSLVIWLPLIWFCYVLPFLAGQ